MNHATAPDPSRSPTLDSAAIIADIEALLDTEIFSGSESHGPLFRAAFAWLILNLHDLLHELERCGARLSHVADSDEDVTALISRMRYAIVHAAAGAKRRLAQGDSTTGGAPGRFLVLIGDASGYADDIAVEAGGVRVLLRRHAVRTFEAARERLIGRDAVAVDEVRL